MRTFAAQRVEGAVQLAQRLSRANSLQYRFAFRQVTVQFAGDRTAAGSPALAAGARGIAVHVLYP